MQIIDVVAMIVVTAAVIFLYYNFGFEYTILSVVLTIPVWLLWNWFMPTIFGISEITLLQGWGLSLLLPLLIRSLVSK